MLEVGLFWDDELFWEVFCLNEMVLYWELMICMCYFEI